MDKISKEDGELLELAAKAAGHKINWMKNGCGPYWISIGGDKEWNPLTDDGDALRLAIALGIHIRVWRPQKMVNAEWSPSSLMFNFIDVPFYDDEMAATRRAIVRAAAEIGKTL